jgi:hypothetical protein
METMCVLERPGGAETNPPAATARKSALKSRLRAAVTASMVIKFRGLK